MLIFLYSIKNLITSPYSIPLYYKIQKLRAIRESCDGGNLMINTNKNSRYVIVEGNIGAGKSTLLKIIQSKLNISVLFEPVEKWQSVDGTENLLEKFYNDATRWAYTFQSYAFITRVLMVEDALKAENTEIVVLERSVFSDRYCFAKNCYEQGFMTALEWKLYQEWFAWLVEQVMTKPAGFIYLRTDPITCYQRIAKRGRHEESPVSLHYLQQLHDKHEQWLVDKENIAPYLRDLPILILDACEEFEHNTEKKNGYIQKVKEFLSIPVVMPVEQPRSTISV